MGFLHCKHHFFLHLISYQINYLRLYQYTNENLLQNQHKISINPQTEKTRLNIHKLINRAYYFMEHLSELVLTGEDPLKKGQMFSFLFEDLPTYDDHN